MTCGRGSWMDRVLCKSQVNWPDPQVIFFLGLDFATSQHIPKRLLWFSCSWFQLKTGTLQIMRPDDGNEGGSVLKSGQVIITYRHNSHPKSVYNYISFVLCSFWWFPLLRFLILLVSIHRYLKTVGGTCSFLLVYELLIRALCILLLPWQGTQNGRCFYGTTRSRDARIYYHFSSHPRNML